jgi:hypothetical protein
MLHAARGTPLCATPRRRVSQASAARARVVVAAAAAPPPPPPPSHAASRRAALLTLTAACAAATAAPLPPPAFAAAAAAAPAPPPAVASLAPFTARCGATLLLPAGWVTASNRENAGKGAFTLNLVGDFDAVDTVSLRRELLPEGVPMDGSLPAAEVAARLTAPESAAVAAGEAKGAVAGVVSGSSGTLSFDVLSSAQRPARPGAPAGARPYYAIETRSEQCRGLVQEGKGGALVRYCLARTHARCVLSR